MANDYKLKADAIKKLAEQGKHLTSRATMQDICLAIGRTPRTGTTARSIINVFLGTHTEPPKTASIPRYQPTFRPQDPAKLPKHPRQADIDRDQPPMQTMHGIGNYKQPGGFLPEVWR
ncbi:hypothetical protein ACSBPU_12855 [Parapusillimonas sp. JC17]|uniref:hypothetical protein n=1 Tax=Parapusillimonas sp. JC17 TaxID=3445768 RepID=UPI003FA0E90E